LHVPQAKKAQLMASDHHDKITAKLIKAST
jgi:hypothetical protein